MISFDKVPIHKRPYIHVANGMILFDEDGSIILNEDGTAALGPFSPLYRSRNRSEIEYKSAAKCPEFKEKILGHLSVADRILMQKYAGQCIIGRNLSQRLLLLEGEGGASKTAFVLTISRVVGSRNVFALRTQHLTERFEIGRMIGCTLLTGPDVRGDFFSHDGAQVLKSLTGGDKIPAELKRSSARFEVYGIFNAMVTCNEALHLVIREDRSAWNRRLLIVHYDQAFIGQRIPDIDKYLLRKEGEGILAWCVEGAIMLMADLNQYGDFNLTDEQQKRISKLLDESDSLRIFVRGELISPKRKDGSAPDLTVAEVRQAYLKFCGDNEWNAIPFKEIKKGIEALIGEYYQIPQSNDIERGGKDQQGYHNLRLKTADEI